MEPFERMSRFRDPMPAKMMSKPPAGLRAWMSLQSDSLKNMTR